MYMLKRERVRVLVKTFSDQEESLLVFYCVGDMQGQGFLSKKQVGGALRSKAASPPATNWGWFWFLSWLRLLVDGGRQHKVVEGT